MQAQKTATITADREAIHEPSVDQKHLAVTDRPASLPYPILHWPGLSQGEFVELRRGRNLVGTGWVDDITEDGQVIWIHLNHGFGRILIQREDGIEIWRLDPRIRDDHGQNS